MAARQLKVRNNVARFPLIDGGAPNRFHTLGATVAALSLTCLAIGIMPFGRVQLPAHPGFMPAIGALSLLLDGMTATLLLGQAKFSRRRPALRLGVAYLLSALITVPYLLALPGVVADDPLIGGHAAAAWFWCAWHGGFAVCVIRFVLGANGSLRPGDVGRSACLTLVIAACLIAAAMAGLPWLPASLDIGTDGRLGPTGIGPAALVATCVATWLVTVRLRFRTVLGLWLSVALLAASLGVALTLAGGSSFSAGWYAAQAESLVTGMSVLFALLSELVSESRRVAEANSQLERMVRTDVLTGLCNRRAFDLALSSEWRRAQREQTPLSLLMIDIDCFKGFNDRYGHPAGDACLRAVGRVLSGQAYRPADVAARVGGEEFALILPMTEENGAVQVAERLRASIAGLLVSHAGSDTGYVTVSIGTATMRPYAPLSDMSQIVDDADHALYQAKANGRNTVWSSECRTLVPAGA